MIRTLTIIIFIAFTSCVSIDKNNQNTEYKKTNNTDTVSYSYTSYKDISSYLVKNDDKIDTAYFEISYPVFSDSIVNKFVHPYILIDGYENIELAAESFILGYNEFVEESSTQSVTFPWYKNVTSEVWTNTPLFLTVATAVDEFTGGAHGIHYTIISNIDLQSQKKIEINDIIPDNNIIKFTKIAESYFRKKENLSDSATLANDFFFENGIFAVNDNFGLTKSNFIIYYNEYEIRPYAEGPTMLEIPYAAIENILNPTGKKYINSLKESLN